LGVERFLNKSQDETRMSTEEDQVNLLLRLVWDRNCFAENNSKQFLPGGSNHLFSMCFLSPYSVDNVQRFLEDTQESGNYNPLIAELTGSSAKAVKASKGANKNQTQVAGERVKLAGAHPAIFLC
jgi:hypothetical protein